MAKERYWVLSAKSLAELETLVDEAVSEDWMPAGGIGFDGENFYQATFRQ